MKWHMKVNQIIHTLEFLEHGILNYDHDSLTPSTFPKGTVDNDVKKSNALLHRFGSKIGVSPEHFFKRGMFHLETRNFQSNEC